MNIVIKTLLITVCTIIALHSSAKRGDGFQSKVVYQSAILVVTQVSENAFEHTSFLQTEDFGTVPCNGLVVRNNKETIIFDTPTDDKGAEELIRWIKDTLHCKINAVIPTHFHNDCLGGLNVFDKDDIPAYAYYKTIELAKENDFAVPRNSFRDSLRLQVGDTYVTARFLGEGHTQDNVIGYFPAEDILFGGCLIKESGAGKGYLGDANVAAWSATVSKVKKEYPDVEIIIPGHGAYGDKTLLDYTIDLFKVP